MSNMQTTTINGKQYEINRVKPLAPSVEASLIRDKTQEPADPVSWYVASTGNHQGLVIDEADGRNVAVTYDKKDAPLVAASPKLLAALVHAQERLNAIPHRYADTDFRQISNAISEATL